MGSLSDLRRGEKGEFTIKSIQIYRGELLRLSEDKQDSQVQLALFPGKNEGGEGGPNQRRW